MPGLINRTTRSPLPLTASEVTSCVSGYAFGMTALLTYRNPEAQTFEGKFQGVKLEGCFRARDITALGFCACLKPLDAFRKRRIMMDEDLERIAFVANLGTIPPLESISIFISTSSELQTLPSGAVRVLLPAVCVPRVPQPILENASSLSSHQLRAYEKRDGLWLGLRRGDAGLSLTAPRFPWAGVESPTHEIRADADPSARSAKSIVITLANKHTFDRPVEILIHPSEPHMPHVLMEEGDMTPAEYERHLKGKNDFIKGTKKDPSAEKKVRKIIRKRLNKDIPHHPVIMLNFCPDLRTVQPDLRKAQGEFIFLVDRSRSMSGVNINHVKDALLVILKSLMPACLFNIIGFGSTFKTLFPASQPYCESLAIACESIRRIRADMGGTNILSPLKWVIRQPIHRGHPRLLFLLTDGAISNTGKVLELLRNHSCSTRCYSFGIGPNACRRLVQGLAAVSRGFAEFLVEGERLQPKMIKSLKKAMAPVLSDVSVEWVFPESTEVLVSPISTSCLFPGDHLVGYSILCDTSLYLSNPRSVSPRGWGWRGCPGSSGCCRGSVWAGIPAGAEQRGTCVFARLRLALGSAGSRRDQKGQSRSVPSAAAGSSPHICSALSPSQPAHSSLPRGSVARVPGGRPCSTGAACPSATTPTPRQCRTGCSKRLQEGAWEHSMPARACGLRRIAGAPGIWVTGERGRHGHPHRSVLGFRWHCIALCAITSSDWEPQDFDFSAARSSPHSPRTLCKAVVKGLRSNEPVQWEVTFDIRPLFRERESQADGDTDLWSETFHHLAAKSVIRDFEHLAEKECEIEHGNAQLLGSPQAGCGQTLPCLGGAFQQLQQGQTASSSVHVCLFPKLPTSSWYLRASLHALQASLQLACGAFLMNSAFCDAVNIPMEKLKWTSPFACHRLALSPSKSHHQRRRSGGGAGGTQQSTPASAKWQADSGRGSDTDGSEVQALLFDIKLQQQTEPEGMLWATAVALAWLEHSSASYFIEWELVAAKASLWLSEQDFPEGYSLATVKAAAQQLFVLLRHWDENLEFNLLCYNPSSV
uniref:von Willebrand factor A domain containing 5B1 n=1 Tax=Bubo bubo TaxID=30461 RepID=A0A8C0IC71_BUBBB